MRVQKTKVGVRKPRQEYLNPSGLFRLLVVNDIDRILQALPHLTKDDVEEALDYYKNHQDEIEKLIVENDEEVKENWEDVPNLFKIPGT